MRAYNNCEIMVGAGKGLQRSSVWSQVAADIFGKPLRITHFENALFGAALTAAVGVGAIEKLEAGVGSIQYDQQIFPQAEVAAQYQGEVIDRWRSVLGLV